ncbi:hypothetical protein PIB30_115523, partial [Stylosanthes scabra]|nr:hypothetical protein [Stylosanthes scabra]
EFGKSGKEFLLPEWLLTILSSIDPSKECVFVPSEIRQSFASKIGQQFSRSIFPKGWISYEMASYCKD